MSSPHTRLPSPKGLGSVSHEPRVPYRKVSVRWNAVAADSRVLR
jgi:hypothetical protein